jgi:hypothetical protein
MSTDRLPVLRMPAQDRLPKHWRNPVLKPLSQSDVGLEKGRPMITMETARLFFLCCIAVFLVACLDDTPRREQ